MNDPAKNLADAARKALNHWCPTHRDSDHFVCPTLYHGKSLADCTCGAAQEFAKHAELSKALAAYDAAQVCKAEGEAMTNKTITAEPDLVAERERHTVATAAQEAKSMHAEYATLRQERDAAVAELATSKAKLAALVSAVRCSGASGVTLEDAVKDAKDAL